MAPSEVSSTARFDAISATVASTNGSGTGGGVSRIVTRRISTRSFGTVASAGTVEIFCATVMPSTTRANTVYWPSSAG